MVRQGRAVRKKLARKLAKKPATKRAKKPATKRAKKSATKLAKKPATKLAKAAAKKPTRKTAKKKPAATRHQPAATKPKRLAGTKPRPVAKNRRPSANPTRRAKPGQRSERDTEKLAAATHQVLNRTWSSWGALETDVIAHAINPSLMGGPRWPGMRQAYRVAHSRDLVLIASDGLADPYDPGEGPEDTNGLGLEMFAVTDDDIAHEGEHGVVRYGATWLHDLVFQCSHLAARHGQLGELIDELGAVSTEADDVSIPASHAGRFVNPEGRVGVLLSPGFGSLPPRVDGPLGPIRLVRVHLLTLEELSYVLEGGDAARTKLAAKLAREPTRLDRPSFV
jgi:hypothetical protein